MSYQPCNFDREDYLLQEEVFEGIMDIDVDNELSEFNCNPDDLAFELAFSRYRIAKLEQEINMIGNFRLGFALCHSEIHREDIKKVQKDLLNLLPVEDKDE